MSLVQKGVESAGRRCAMCRKQTSRPFAAKVGQRDGTVKEEFSTVVQKGQGRRSDFHVSEPIWSEGVTVGVWLLRLTTTDWRLTCVST